MKNMLSIFFALMLLLNCSTMEAVDRDNGVKPFSGTRYALHEFKKTTHFMMLPGACLKSIILIDLPLSFVVDLVLLPFALIFPAGEENPEN